MLNRDPLLSTRHSSSSVTLRTPVGGHSPHRPISLITVTKMTGKTTMTTTTTKNPSVGPNDQFQPIAYHWIFFRVRTFLGLHSCSAHSESYHLSTTSINDPYVTIRPRLIAYSTHVIATFFFFHFRHLFPTASHLGASTKKNTGNITGA